MEDEGEEVIHLAVAIGSEEEEEAELDAENENQKKNGQDDMAWDEEEALHPKDGKDDEDDNDEVGYGAL